MANFEDIGFCKVDYDRESRTGYPEVVFGEGKTKEQIVQIMNKLIDKHHKAMVTRITKEKAEYVQQQISGTNYDETSRIITYGTATKQLKGTVLVICAGTSDLPVAEEAVQTAEWMGCETSRLYDVGVAGIDRLLAYRDEIRKASVLIVVAGMEGALASVITGLVSSPVIAVPTSVGYGANLHGITTLLAMLNGCASGMSVVNIDNGFGAAYQAASILRLVTEAG